MIETFARLREPELPPQALPYIRKVTIVWCVFFVLNGGIALYTALFSRTQVWSLYNGAISYVPIGLLMTVEWVCRQWIRGRLTIGERPETGQ